MPDIHSYYAVRFDRDNSLEFRKGGNEEFRILSYTAAASNMRIQSALNQSELVMSVAVIIAPVLYGIVLLLIVLLLVLLILILLVFILLFIVLLLILLLVLILILVLLLLILQLFLRQRQIVTGFIVLRIISQSLLICFYTLRQLF